MNPASAVVVAAPTWMETGTVTALPLLGVKVMVAA
jgi:hypothetical protein